MRRGDFVFSHKKDFGHMAASGRYLRKAIDYYKTRHKDSPCLKFLIYGNDYDWNRAQVKEDRNVIVMKLSSPAVDMCVLSSCNHTMMSTGTFGFWAAFLSGGHATYQREFARFGSQHFEEYSETDFFRPGWVSLWRFNGALQLQQFCALGQSESAIMFPAWKQCFVRLCVASCCLQTSADGISNKVIFGNFRKVQI